MAESSARPGKAQSEMDELQQEHRDLRAAQRASQQEAEVKAHTYTVKAGDSLSKIAKEVYGDAARWPEILEANRDKIKDPNVIEPGWELHIP